VRPARLAFALLTLSATLAAAQEWKNWIPSLPRTTRGWQGDAAKKMLPVGVMLRPRGASAYSDKDPHVLRVRVHAAADYRRATSDWQPRFRRILARVNERTKAWPGVRFEVVEVREWERESSEKSMETLIDELARRDPGQEVDVVVGLVSAMPVFPAALDAIGMARFHSKHMVLRSLHDLAEYNYMAGAFDALTPRERDVIMSARKVHKEEVLFLHEWGHMLGLIHTKRFASVMHPGYDTQQTGFGDVESRMIEISLKHRLSDPEGGVRAAIDEIRGFVVDHRDPDWDAADRWTPAWMKTAPDAPRPGAPPDRPLEVKDRPTFAEAVELERAGSFDKAWNKIAMLERRYPRNPEVRMLTCQLAWRRPPDAARVSLVEMACRSAIDAAPSNHRPHLFLADAYLASGDLDKARAPLSRALDLLSASQGEPDPEAWRVLATSFQRADLPTLAERAAVRAGHETEVAVGEWAARLRKFSALPTDGIAPEREAVYLRTVRDVRAALGTPQEAELFAQATKDFEGKPLVALLRCESALQAGRLPAVKTACPSLKGPRGATIDKLRAMHVAELESPPSGARE
jgi:hypothetical protein